MSDTTTPSAAEVYGPVPEIIGWTWDKQAVNWRDANGEIRYNEDLAETPTPDDMLAWLVARPEVDEPQIWWDDEEGNWVLDPGILLSAATYRAPTLHAALEQAVIAVGCAE